ncbi:MAG: hypothetical protein G01um101477_247 [Candidatus Doudnabacteria bacterium Gr01-1014_77]|uniref:Uncharacterized protein n=1 Tax=Candidatus Doudnabacteria bacterium Gr01-1014_77 TaxID=2017133 RepID=A0A554JCL5_9BACT|nr:MAG: hypothetical protein G01um101477_247 [Candidatus Doudnabacteria bacterium Gr01-1014_77]
MPKPRLHREAFDAYFSRLPSEIEVDWFRDGQFIIGEVEAGELKFRTQGKNVDDFIEMVNDAIIRLNNIPEEYINTVRSFQAYTPSVEERAKLADAAVESAKIFAKKDKRALQLA